MLSGINCVLFDLDGVLVDACEWHYDALNLAMSSLGYEPISRMDHINKYNGLPTKTKLKLLEIPSDVIERINHRKQEYTVQIIKDKSKIRPEKVELLLFLKENNVKTGCVTNSIRSSAELMLKTCGVLPLLDILISNEDIKCPKPSPEGYNTAMLRLKADPGHTMCVEDSPIGIKSAKASLAEHLWEIDDISMVNLVRFKEKLNADFNSDGGRGKSI